MRRRPAFTLVELVVVIVVLGILSGVAVQTYFTHADKARESSEQAVVGAVRAGINQHMMNQAVTGSSAPPATLDSVASGAAASAAAPMFAEILNPAITDGWTKGADAYTYVGPTGKSYGYDPATGRFGEGVTPTLIPPGGPGSGSAPALTLSSQPTWTAAPGAPITQNQFFASGYSLTNGEIWLDDAGGFSMAAQRIAMTGQAIEAGQFELKLDTTLTNYWNQLNYWQVYAVQDAAALNLTGGQISWGSAPAGTKLLAQNYAPEEKSDGSWYSYTDTINVSAADAANYDQIIVVMAGSKNNGQILGWRNVSLTKK